MIGTCPSCGNYKRDKEIVGNEIRCPKCGHHWEFEKLPVFFLTGCSGIGKTTTAQELQKITDEFIILDSDLFYTMIRPQNDAEKYEMLEQILSLTKDINQAKKPVL